MVEWLSLNLKPPRNGRLGNTAMERAGLLTVPANGRKNTGVQYAAEPRSRCHVWNNVLLQTVVYIGVLYSARENRSHNRASSQEPPEQFGQTGHPRFSRDKIPK